MTALLLLRQRMKKQPNFYLSEPYEMDSLLCAPARGQRMCDVKLQ